VPIGTNAEAQFGGAVILDAAGDPADVVEKTRGDRGAAGRMNSRNREGPHRRTIKLC
jgi:hypothetical protein